MTDEEEMRQALFGAAKPDEPSPTRPLEPVAIIATPSLVANKRKAPKPFAPRLQVILRVGNEFEGKTELFTHEADTLSTLQAELDATKIARKKYRFVELISVKPMK